ncbi:hypothetical protein GGI15_001567 [Coemansia interrupta]|uniref:Myb-like domain-containing protein n=1 Tax=Coemansia interrupta TaxID=1126814 RepID=A0A9W8HI84_9FUNG|nr:hypothetical protein GGI15_001567 [Coemansia interrupta]
MSPQRKVAESIIHIISDDKTAAPEHGSAGVDEDLETAAPVAGEAPADVASAIQKEQSNDENDEDNHEGPPSSIGMCSDTDSSDSEDSDDEDADSEDTDGSSDDADQEPLPKKSGANDDKANGASNMGAPSQSQMGKDGSMPQDLESIPMATIGADNESYSADVDSVRNVKPIVSNTQNEADDSPSDNDSSSGSSSSSGTEADGSGDSDTDSNDGDGGSSNKGMPPGEQTSQSIPILGPGTAADLMILDYISHQILQEVVELGVLFEKSGYSRNADVLAKLKRIRHLAGEHALVRKQHFTHSLYLQNDQRPGGDLDMLQWGASMLRINQATFALLVLCPEMVIDDKLDRKLPCRRRLLISAGFGAAADGFFEHVVPTSKRNGNSVGLLVDMQTQQWLAGADDEKQLKSILDQAREFDDVAIGQLLSMDDADDSMQAFDATAISVYRGNVNQRLNKLSGRRLNSTRLHYTLEAVQRRVALFVGECAEAMSPPVIATIASSEQAGGDGSFVIDEAGDESEVDDDEIQASAAHAQDVEHGTTEDPAAGADEAQGNGDSQISNDVEVTIYKSRAEIDRIRALKDAAAAGDAASVVPESLADQSFAETRRVASVMRDVADDAHIDELLATIEHEEIDISTADTPESHARRQMRSRAPSPPHTVPDTGASARRGSSAEEDDGFQLSTGDGALSDDGDDGNVPSGPRNGSVKTLSERRDEMRQAGTRSLRVRRSAARIYRDTDDSEVDNPDAEEDMIRAIQRPTKRTRVQYSHPDDRGTPGSSRGFRGRRGIAAEDPATFEDEDDSVRFTPSIQGSPAPSSQEQQHSGPDWSRPYASPGSRLGQYKPVVMVRDEMVQTPSMDGRRTRSAGSATPKPKPKPGRTQKRKRWSPEEERCFISAVHEHGLRWSLILSFHGKYGSVDNVLKGRTREHLKDKARNIKIRLQREQRPLGPFAEATGGIST